MAQSFDALDAASCALLVDLDNNQDVDLALIDEVAGVVFLVGQRPSPLYLPYMND